MAWRPGRIEQGRALEQPFDDVPEHLLGPLWSWINALLSSSREATEHLVITLRLVAPDPHRDHGGAIRALIDFVNEVEDDTQLLDLAEMLLSEYGNGNGRASRLEALLSKANSAYAVRADCRGLEMRVLPEARDLVAEAIESAKDHGSIGAHLTNAWNEAFGRSPDPVKSYSESIKAVEAAAAPVLTPNDLKATLGTLIGHLKSNSASWRFAIADGERPGVEVALDMMKALWQGQTSRHGGVAPTVPETAGAAQAAVFLAAALTQWFVGGAITRID